MAGTDNQTDPSKLPELPLSWIQDAELLEIPAGATRLLKDYSKISEDEILPHVNQVRDQALKTYPYPCIGHYRFLDIQIVRSPAYNEIKHRLNHGQQLLDVGCCIGQELRQLIFDGASSENLYGTDLYGNFFDIGYDLFRDKTSIKTTFIIADIFLNQNLIPERINGTLDIVWTSNVLHLFSWDKQIAALTMMLKLLTESSDPLIAGRFMGHAISGVHKFGFGGKEESQYRHNGESFKKLFQTACDELGQVWEVDVEAPEWTETLKFKSKEKLVSTWTLEIKFVARRSTKNVDST